MVVVHQQRVPAAAHMVILQSTCSSIECASVLQFFIIG